MRKRTKAAPKKWTLGLDDDQVQGTLEEATVDAYDEYERHTGLLTMIQDQVEFPFHAQVLGETVTVVSMEWPEDDQFGLDFVCERNGGQHRVEARSVEITEPFPEGHLFIAAYLARKRKL